MGVVINVVLLGAMIEGDVALLFVAMMVGLAVVGVFAVLIFQDVNFCIMVWFCLFGNVFVVVLCLGFNGIAGFYNGGIDVDAVCLDDNAIAELWEGGLHL